MGQYTNGFNTSKVIDALVGRLGWKQPTFSTFGTAPVINSTNLASRSARYFNDGSFHPLVTIDNIKAVVEDSSISDNNLNSYLQDLQKSIIMQCLTAIFNQPELIDQILLFERSLNNDQLIPNDDNFVGVRFRLAPGNVAVQINSIALYFNQDVTFDLYLYHDTKKDALWSQSVTASANDQTIIVPTNELILNNTSVYRSGFFYLGYYQNDLGSAQAYYEQTIRGQYLRKRTYAFGYDFFQAARNADDFNHIGMPISFNNFGLNAEVTSFWDHTDKIIRNAPLFDNVTGLQMAYHICKQVLYAVRSNRNERILKEALDKIGLAYELDGKVPVSDVPKSTGLQDRINQELTKLNQTFFPKGKAQMVSLDQNCNVNPGYANYENGPGWN